MNTQFNKALAAFVAALATMLGYANIHLPDFMLDPNVQGFVGAALVGLVTWLVPNKPTPVSQEAIDAIGQQVAKNIQSGTKLRAHPAVVLVALAVACSMLAGCSTLKTVGDLSTVKNPVTMREVFIAQASYDAAVLAPAANYRRLGLCAGETKSTVEKPCAERRAVRELQKADLLVQQAFRDIKAYIAVYPGELGVIGLYDALKVAVAQAQAVIAVYGVKQLGVTS